MNGRFNGESMIVSAAEHRRIINLRTSDRAAWAVILPFLIYPSSSSAPVSHPAGIFKFLGPAVVPGSS
jgi:hypothetical protein